MKNPFLLFFSALLFASCIQIRVNDDGSRDLGPEARKNLAPFRLEDTGSERPVKQSGDIIFQEINADNLKSQVRLGKKTWIFFWGSWCAPCRQKLPLISKLQRDNPDWNILLVAEDYKLAELQKLLFTNQISTQPYILDYRRYGTQKSEKTRRLWEELAPGKNLSEGYPQNFLYDQNGVLLYYGIGALPDEILQKNFVVK